jgi:hypothetical protein
LEFRFWIVRVDLDPVFGLFLIDDGDAVTISPDGGNADERVVIENVGIFPVFYRRRFRGERRVGGERGLAGQRRFARDVCGGDANETEQRQ